MPTSHVNAKGRLAVDLTVERAATSAPTEAQNRTIGVIPIDAIFSPVRRVIFTVEPTRAEQSTNFDRLQLDIETDGSINPKEAAWRPPAPRCGRWSTSWPTSPTIPRASSWARWRRWPARRTWSWPSRTSTCPSVPATASAGPDQHHRRAAHEDRGRPAQHHQLRAEEPRRGQGQARRARPVAALRSERCRPLAARRFGGSPSHQRLMMANLAASLFAAEAIVTTEAKAKARGPWPRS